MSNGNGWVMVNPGALVESDNTQHRRGITIDLLMSPYDVPEAFKGSYDSDKKRFVIAFRYMDNEDTKAVPLRDHVEMLVGKNSKRIRAIQIDVDALKVEQVALRIQHAIEELKTVENSSQRNEHYATLRKLLSDKWGKLSPSLANTTIEPSGAAA